MEEWKLGVPQSEREKRDERKSPQKFRINEREGKDKNTVVRSNKLLGRGWGG